MKLFFAIFILAFMSLPSEAQKPELDKAARSILARQFSSWGPAEIRKEIVEYYNVNRIWEQPNRIAGDWNGDGRRDLAVLLQHKREASRRILLVLLRSGRGYSPYILESDDCLMSIKKGEAGYDFETGRKFRYRNDAIFSYIFEKAGTSYIWEKNRFRRIVTSD